eukprot:352724-Chlamydomonas_euryale.AAC.2
MPMYVQATLDATGLPSPALENGGGGDGSDGGGRPRQRRGIDTSADPTTFTSRPFRHGVAGRAAGGLPGRQQPGMWPDGAPQPKTSYPTGGGHMESGTAPRTFGCLPWLV